MEKLKRTIKYDEISILKIKENIEPLNDKNNYLMVKRNPSRIKINDLVLLPESCPLSTYWFQNEVNRCDSL